MGRYLHPNQLKYIKAPTIEMIDRVRNAYGVDEKQFERFFGFYRETIKKVRRGERKLPVEHWHTIYECLRLIDEGKPLPLYRDEVPQAPSTSSFNKKLLNLFKTKKKKKPRTKAIKRTGTLCELC